MKRMEIKKLLPCAGIILMCMSLTACGQSASTEATEVSETVVSADKNLSESSDTNADNSEATNEDSEASKESGGAGSGDNAEGTKSGDNSENAQKGGNSGNGEKPDGAPNGEKPDGAPDGEKPDGAPDGEKPDGAPNGEKPDDAPDGEKPDGAPGGGFGGGGNSSADIDYQGATEITSSDSQDGEKYASTTADESALLISTSDSVTISDAVITKTGDSDGGDNCNFYGLNAAVLVKDGSTTTITGATITSDADGANGVFSYGGNGGQNGADGDGTTVNISDSTITTTGNGSGGIMTTGGGITNAKNLTVETSGQSSAAIRTDRGGGTVTVDGGTYTTNGVGSPSIYSTADITVSNATLLSNTSEAVCIEGMNSITLTDCDMTANNTEMNSNATFYDSIMIYQSMSGDADSGTSTFDMTGGSLTSKNGHVFHVTNTNAVINLESVKITNEDSDNILLSVCDDGWSGSDNIATINAKDQDLEGTILVGDNSTLTLNLTEGSSFTGCISGDITNYKGDTVSTEVGTVNVTLDGSSTWTLTADTYISSFDGDTSSIISNGYTLYVNGTAIN